jgi:hypothetical protein
VRPRRSPAWSSRPSTSPLAVAMKAQWLVLGAVVFLILGVVAAALRSRVTSRLTSVAEAFLHAAAMVAVSEDRADCTVYGRDGTPGREISCVDLGDYLQRDLKLGGGASIGIKALGNVSPDVVLAVSNEITSHGFTVAGVIRVR